MQQKFKPKKCKVKSCRKEFQPVVEWQKYCSDPCRYTIANEKRAALVRRAQKIINEAVGR